MTQSVQWPQRQSICHEAWQTARTCEGPPFVDLRIELRSLRRFYAWPLFLTIELPFSSPPEWCGLIGSRLLTVMVPQLWAAGFFPRPLCVERPYFLIALWPKEALTHEVCQETIILELKERLAAPLFALCVKSFAESRLSVGGDAALQDLLPFVDIQPMDPLVGLRQHDTGAQTLRRL